MNIQARSQAYSHTRASTSNSKNEKNKWPKNGVKVEALGGLRSIKNNFR